MFDKKINECSHALAVSQVLSYARGKFIHLPGDVEIGGGVLVWAGLITSVTEKGSYRTVEILTADGGGTQISTSIKLADLERIISASV